MTQYYDIEIDSPLGPRRGRLAWGETEGRVTGSLSLMGFDNPVDGRRDGARLELTHKIRTALSMLQCRTVAELSGGELSGSVAAGGCSMPLSGRRAARPEPDADAERRTSLGAGAEE